MCTYIDYATVTWDYYVIAVFVKNFPYNKACVRACPI